MFLFDTCYGSGFVSIYKLEAQDVLPDNFLT